MTGRRPSKNGSAEGRRDDEEYSYGSRDRAILANLGKKQALKVCFPYKLMGHTANSSSGTLASYPWWCEQRQSDTSANGHSADLSIRGSQAH